MLTSAVLLVSLLPGCGPSCGEGTVEENGECVAAPSEGGDTAGGDADTDSDADTDTDVDTVTDLPLEEGSGGAEGTAAWAVSVALPVVQEDWRSDARVVAVHGSGTGGRSDRWTVSFLSAGRNGYKYEYTIPDMNPYAAEGEERESEIYASFSPIENWYVNSDEALASLGQEDQSAGLRVFPLGGMNTYCPQFAAENEDPAYPYYWIEWQEGEPSVVLDGRTADVLYNGTCAADP